MTENTVFIIGAGASEEANMPTGYKLRPILAEKLGFYFNRSDLVQGNRKVLETLKSYAAGKEKGLYQTLIGAAKRTASALPLAISIDNFVDAHRGNKEIAVCSKIAIIYSILEAERESLLRLQGASFPKEIDFYGLSSTWYLSFFQIITENCDKEQLVDRFRNIKLIIFNYDRCIEHFLIQALITYYGMDEDTALNILKTMKIYHPYGTVGSILDKNISTYAEFGANLQSDEVLSKIEEIKTFTEGVDEEESSILAIRDAITQCDSLIFLGFGFHELNMQLLTPKMSFSPNIPKCYASAYGFEENSQTIIRDRIRALYSHDIVTQSDEISSEEVIEIKNVKCKDFFAHYLMSLKY